MWLAGFVFFVFVWLLLWLWERFFQHGCGLGPSIGCGFESEKAISNQKI
jgi:hypothetical protein